MFTYTGSQSSDHYATGYETDSAKVDESSFRCNVGNTGHQGTGTTSSLLVDLGEKGISRVGDDGSGNSSNNTRSERDNDVLSTGAFSGGRAHGLVDVVSSISLHDELSASVRNLLGKDRNKTSVESTNSLGLGNLLETVNKTVAELRIRDGTDTDSLQRTEEDISDKFSAGSRYHVDTGLVVPCTLGSEGRGSLDLEEFDSTELEPSLDEVSESGGSQTSGQSHGSLLSNDLTESSDQTLVVL